ncbi:MAG: hypothetical protein H7Y27_11685, partial [Gemmatimonadaceae bacterium]|nr:hypothetical protein [Chitinophagaceae bacterium]
MFCLFIFLISISSAFSQAPQIRFSHLTTENGLTDGTVKAITQDKYGYIWLATQYGLCRYNGYEVKKFFHNRNDSGSIAGNFSWSLLTDHSGNVWIGNERWLSLFNYAGNSFTNFPTPFNASVVKMKEGENGRLWLATSAGLMSFEKTTGKFNHYRDHPDTSLRNNISGRINDFSLDSVKGLLYLATQKGLHVFNYRTQQLNSPGNNKAVRGHADINTSVITAVTKDNDGFIWMGCGFTNSVIVKYNPATGQTKDYHDFTETQRDWKENRALSMFTDISGNVWVGGFTSSLSVYMPAVDRFHHYVHDPLLKTSIAGTSINHIYQDARGNIWIGSEGYGSDRFDPAPPTFTTFQPTSESHSLLHDWGRAAMEDSRGNLWFGTSKGISVYDTLTGHYKNHYNSEKNPSLLSFNTIRSFAEDHKGHVWIGTGNWLNRYDPQTGKFTIYNQSDSLHSSFVWALLATRDGSLYAGGTGGLQKFDYGTQKFISPTDNPDINKMFGTNVRNIFEDSAGDLWIGMYNGGLIHFSPNDNTAIHYLHNENDSTSLSSNFVTSVAEDKKSILWISTRDGLNRFDRKSQKFSVYATSHGLSSNKTSALRVDQSNRLWVATGNGISMLDTSRKNFLNFDITDGLPTNELNDQTAATTISGKFIYPTYRGFFVFDPRLVQGRKFAAQRLYITDFRVFNDPIATKVNFEQVKSISLKYDQDFFTIQLTALDNFSNPGKVYYAYRLDPFNKEWIYTQDRNISYTNLRGGDYQFFYKASHDPANWNVETNMLQIHIDTVFYKTAWFIGVIALV